VKVLFGLGNPGKKYQNTRHNAGFMFLDEMYNFLGWDSNLDVMDWTSNKKMQALISKVKFTSETSVLLAKPLTFMNKAGISALKIVNWFDVDVEKQFVLIHDDLDIEFGKFKLQKGVSPKSHNGVLSVERMLGKRDFLRLRIGVDDRHGDRTIPPEDYVLKKLSSDKKVALHEVLTDAVKSLRSNLEI
jgi:PTH1 family peptidyl-tRNA hydrolase